MLLLYSSACLVDRNRFGFENVYFCCHANQRRACTLCGVCLLPHTLTCSDPNKARLQLVWRVPAATHAHMFGSEQKFDPPPTAKQIANEHFALFLIVDTPSMFNAHDTHTHTVKQIRFDYLHARATHVMHSTTVKSEIVVVFLHVVWVQT